MTVIRPNSVSGITSITAQANEINFFRSNGTLAGLQLNGVNFNTTTGVSTFNNLNVGGVLTYQDVTNVDSIGIITARSGINVSGGGLVVTGISTTTTRLDVGNNGTNAVDLRFRSNRASAGQTIANLNYEWNGTTVAQIRGIAGSDTTNKDDGHLAFYTTPAGSGSFSERLRITSGGNLGVAGATGTDFSLLDGMVINTANGSAGLLINSSSSSHNAYLGFSYGSGSSTSHADQYSAYIGRVGDDTLILGTNNNIRVQITSEGQLLLSGNNSGNHMSGFGTNVGGLTIDDVGNQHTALEVSHGSNKVYLVASSNNSVYTSSYGTGNFILEHTGGGGTRERIRITSAGNILINNSNGGAEAINLVGNGGGILISRAASGVPSNGQTLADIGLNSYSSSQTCSSADVLIRGQAAGNHSGSSAPSDLLFFTKPSSTGPGSAPTERFRIRHNGNTGIGEADPQTKLHVAGSICGGTSNQPFLRFFDSSDRQRNTKHYFKCVKGSTTIFDILTVDINQNFHQALIILYYGARIQNISDSVTYPVHKIIGVNRFNGGSIQFTKNTIVQNANAANHADIDAVATSSTNYRIRLTYGGSAGGSSFCCGSVEIIGVGSGDDGCFYSLSHAHGLLA